MREWVVEGYGFYLHFNNMNRVPTSLNLHRVIARLLNQDYSSKAVIQVPHIHRRHTTVKIPATNIISQLSDMGEEERGKRNGEGGILLHLSILVKCCVGFKFKFSKPFRGCGSILERGVVLIAPGWPKNKNDTLSNQLSTLNIGLNLNGCNCSTFKVITNLYESPSRL